MRKQALCVWGRAPAGDAGSVGARNSKEASVAGVEQARRVGRYMVGGLMGGAGATQIMEVCVVIVRREAMGRF